MVRVKWHFLHVKLANPHTLEYRRPVYHWSKQTEISQPEQTGIQYRHDSASQQSSESNVVLMPDRAPPEFRSLHGFIQGTPQTGWYDLLDSSQCLKSAIRIHRLNPTGYRMRTGAEAQTFFVVGRVISGFQIFNCPNHFRRCSRCYTLSLPA
jgi:hypothetical protein